MILDALTVIQQRVGSGACAPGKQVRTQDASPPLAKAGSLAAGVGAVLASLVRVATDVARADEMAAQLKASAPTGDEALKWHEIALRSVAWSREALVQEQSALLKELQALARGPPPGSKAESSSDSASTAAGSDRDSVSESGTSQDGGEQSDGSEKPQAGAPLDLHRRWTEESAREVAGSLSDDLLRLQAYSAGRCLLVRKIKPLGLEQPRRLREHFERWGPVTDVLVAHSYEKPSARRRHGRVRCASLGFVIMSSEEAASAVLEASEMHMVEGGPVPCEVSVYAYDPHARRPDGSLVMPDA